MQEDQRGVKEVEHKQRLRVRQQTRSYLLPGLKPRHISGQPRL